MLCNAVERGGLNNLKLDLPLLQASASTFPPPTSICTTRLEVRREVDLGLAERPVPDDGDLGLSECGLSRRQAPPVRERSFQRSPLVAGQLFDDRDYPIAHATLWHSR